jgi:hypothetical protein
MVLALTVAGKLPSQAKISVQDETGTGPGAGAGAGGGQRMGAGSLNGMRNKGQMFRQHTAPGANDALDLSALIFSVSSGRSVGRIALEYTGTSVDEAISKFAAKIHESLPAASCTGWTWEGKVDPERIKAIEP